MAYDARGARQDLLTAIAEATDALALALAALGAAYEQLDEQSADRLEERLFRPAQAAYGRAKRTHAGFAQRSGLPQHEFLTATSAGPPSQGVRGFIERALDAVDDADAILVDLQDSMRPVEVGDAELRAGLADVRGLVGGIGDAGREFMRTFGR
jgi:hypothetical protein